jgi:hypothetical protein
MCKNSACSFIPDTGQALAYPLDLNTEYELRSGGATHICSSGWSDPEDWGVWSDSGKARLAILAIDLRQTPHGDIMLSIYSRIAFHEEYPEPTIYVRVNGADLSATEFNSIPISDDFAWRSIRIPAFFFHAKLLISFHVDRPLPPQPSDTRQLGIAIARLKLTRV